jgi:uncharacterized protein
MRGALGITAAVVVLAAVAGPAGAAPALAPTPTAWVTDRARLLAPETVERLDARLAEVERASGRQVLVFIDRSTGGVPLEDWTARAFAAWHVGRKGLDDGVVLFVFTEDRRLRIEVGYGLEATIPDARAARILSEVVAPPLKAGQPDRAIEAGVDALLSALGSPVDGSPDERVPGWALVVGIAVFLFFMTALATHPGLAAWLLLLGAGRGNGGRRGGWFSGGGFSGGGGRSGGGGASGSW